MLFQHCMYAEMIATYISIWLGIPYYVLVGHIDPFRSHGITSYWRSRNNIWNSVRSSVKNATTCIYCSLYQKLLLQCMFMSPTSAWVLAFIVSIRPPIWCITMGTNSSEKGLYGRYHPHDCCSWNTRPWTLQTLQWIFSLLQKHATSSCSTTITTPHYHPSRSPKLLWLSYALRSLPDI